jgi:predicted ATPase
MRNVKLNKLSIQNFKAFGEMVDVPIRPITLIFGENSAGKSSILHSLLFLESLEKKGIFSDVQMVGENVDIGGTKNFIHSQDLQNSVQLTQKYNLTWESSVIPEFQTHETSLSSFVAKTNTKIRFDNLDYCINVSINTLDNTKTSIEYTVNGQPILLITNIVKSSENAEYYNVTCTIPTSILENWIRANKDYMSLRKILTQQEEDEVAAHYLIETENGLKPYYPEVETATIRNHAIDKLLTHISLASSYPTDDISQTITFDVKHFYKKPTLAFETDQYYENIDYIRFYDSEYHGLHQIIDTYNEIQQFSISIVDIDDIIIAISAANNRLNTLPTYRHIGPLRIIPERYMGKKQLTSETLMSGEVIWEVIQKYPEVCNYVNQWLTRLQIPYQLKYKLSLDTQQLLFDIGRDVSQIAELHSIDAKQFLEKYYTVEQFYFENTSGNSALKLSPRDLGVGVSQIIPVITTCAVKNAITVLIEQPELHLHPRLQGDLADLFIETAIKGDQHNTYVIETHSEHIIRRIMRRIREDRNKGTDEVRITKDDVAILYVAPGPHGSTVTHLRLDDEGDLIDEWPNGFFEESFRDDMAGR